jgi:hypothetical protein
MSPFTFPHPTYKKPHTSSPSDPVNLFLGLLWERDTDHATLIVRLQETLRQTNAPYESWESEKRAELFRVNSGAQEIDRRMGELYEEKLKKNLKVAVEETRALIKELETFAEGAEMVLKDM